jgi:Rrf2 family transcriptional regulator, cysteine metabolism repressor
MKISKKAYYGLRAVVALAQNNKAISIHTLAKAEKLPEDYLEKILQILRRSGIVEAKKGVAGGYALVRTAKNINVWNVLRELDGPIKTFAPIKGALPCLHVSHCQTNKVWRILEEEIEKTLTKIKISDLLISNF